jgi:alkyldihydroxyacetonephosphate synthase
MNQVNCENDWWKWGEAAKRKSLTDYPKLKVHIEQRWNKTFNEKKVAPASFNINSDEQRAQQVISIFEKDLPQIKISNSVALRLKKSAGKSYPDLLAAITNSGFSIPDAVVYPKNHDEVLQVLQLASKHKILVVPFGGGSNVVRAFNLKDAELLPRIVLDLAEMNNVISIDETNHTATFQSGIFGPALEKILNQKQFTLGHFPQSFEYSTLGGWIATRSAGQESSTYGRIEDIVISLKAATPVGEINTSVYEGDAEGISIKSLFYGSEALLGVVTEAKVRIHPLPPHKKWLVAVFPTYQNGLNAIQQLVQANIFPSVVRYSDEHETFFLSLLSHETSSLSKLKSKISKLVLKIKNLENPSLMMIRLDGDEQEAEIKREIAATIFGKHKGFDVGESLGKKWETSRFGLPYLRDDLMERGIFVDTMETVVPWNKADALRKKLNSVLQNCEAFHRNKGILLAHVSHVYTSSASLYFTILTAMNEQNAYAQWEEIKTLVTDTIVQEGGAVSHHHSIGTDHQKWYLQKTDALTKKILLSVKQTVDPHHILNPGKLFDE